MSIKFSVGNFESNKKEILDFVKDKKSKGIFKVVDIGGWAGGWTKDIVDLIVDINVVDSDNSLQLNVCGDISKLLLYVEKNGKFDYCICSHTLEDLYNPYTLLDNFVNIAKSGIIMVPFYKTELSFVESQKWLGYIHHRYIFKESNGKLLVIPKMPFLESFGSFNYPILNFNVFWENKLEYELFMDNYLGPDINIVLTTFKLELL